MDLRYTVAGLMLKRQRRSWAPAATMVMAMPCVCECVCVCVCVCVCASECARAPHGDAVVVM